LSSFKFQFRVLDVEFLKKKAIVSSSVTFGFYNVKAILVFSKVFV
tara:strand:+ start:56075 stop:56209 length:135 start_codon:yes stop_codon:yes gene_type:complete